jgi:signal transduction histidine kinase
LGESITYARRELEIPRPVPEGTLYLGVNTSLIRNEQQDVIGVSILLTDLTNIRVLEREMADRQRLADLGGMAAGLAHQLRNSIAAILGYGKMLRREASGRAKETDWADAIVQETMETSDMVTRFLEFARPLEGDRSTVELMEVLGDAIEVCRPVLLQHGTRVIEPTVHSRADHRIEGDALLLKQVFVNLLQNAAEAAGPEGVVHIEADERLADDGANRRVVVRVRDNGPGIPDDVRADLFQPFFTTKETGTGLGLALAKKIITHHGGSLCLLHSGPTGTVFEVSLPAIRAKTTAASSAAHV